jgi:hypothetical protein
VKSNETTLLKKKTIEVAVKQKKLYLDCGGAGMEDSMKLAKLLLIK